MTLKMNQIILLNVLRFINKKFDTLRAIDLFEKKLIHCIYVYFWILINTTTASEYTTYYKFTSEKIVSIAIL